MKRLRTLTEAETLDRYRGLAAREQALLENEQRWKLAVEGIGDGMWDWDVPAHSVFFSLQWKAMLGYDDADIGHDLSEWSDRIHPADLDATITLLRRALLGETGRYESEHRVRRKDGSYAWVLDRGTVVERDADGTATRMIGTHKDISTHKVMESELDRRRVDLEEAQRIARVGSWRLIPSTGEVSWSPALYELFGLDPAGPVPPYSLQATLFAPESWARLDAAAQRCITQGVPYELELETLHADGTPRWMVARGRTWRGPDGEINEIHGIAMDVTERRTAVHRVERLTDLYRTVSECNAALMHATDSVSLYHTICETMVRHAGVLMAWIGEVDRVGARVTPVSCYGTGTDYLDEIEISIDQRDPHGCGPAGTAAREGVAAWFEQFGTDPRTAPWHDRSAVYGWRSAASLPIVRDGQVVAVLSLYSDQEQWLDIETKQLIEGMAAEIGHALDRLDADALLRESEQRFRSLVEQSIAGAFIVQHGRLVYVNPRFKEILGYAEQDDLTGVDPTTLLTPDDRDRTLLLREQFDSKQISSVETTLRARRRDGTTVDVGTHSSTATYQGMPAVIGLMQDLSDRAVAEAHIQRYADQIQRVMFQTVGVITSISEMRDPYTSGHEDRVAELAVAIGREMGWDEARLIGLRVGGQLHDIGKIAVPAEILVKPSALSPLETSLVREHARVGYEILRSIEFPWPVARIALEHHEHLDGSGYPRGLVGEQICPEALIITVADVVESMSSHRPYRPALGIEAALAEIERGAGVEFDRDVVTACTRLFLEHRFALSSTGRLN